MAMGVYDDLLSLMINFCWGLFRLSCLGCAGNIQRSCMLRTEIRWVFFEVSSETARRSWGRCARWFDSHVDCLPRRAVKKGLPRERHFQASNWLEHHSSTAVYKVSLEAWAVLGSHKIKVPRKSNPTNILTMKKHIRAYKRLYRHLNGSLWSMGLFSCEKWGSHSLNTRECMNCKVINWILHAYTTCHERCSCQLVSPKLGDPTETPENIGENTFVAVRFTNFTNKDVVTAAAWCHAGHCVLLVLGREFCGSGQLQRHWDFHLWRFSAASEAGNPKSCGS